jgi:hypothetical protein
MTPAHFTSTAPLRRPKSCRRLTRTSLLESLNLPITARWPEAAPRIKSLIISARENKDDTTAAWLSYVKAYLRKRLLNVCSCGAVIRPRSRQCMRCFQSRRSLQSS